MGWALTSGMPIEEEMKSLNREDPDILTAVLFTFMSSDESYSILFEMTGFSLEDSSVLDLGCIHEL